MAELRLGEQPGGVGGGLGAAFHPQLGEQRRHVILHHLMIIKQEHRDRRLGADELTIHWAGHDDSYRFADTGPDGPG